MNLTEIKLIPDKRITQLYLVCVYVYNILTIFSIILSDINILLEFTRSGFSDSQRNAVL